MPTSEAVIAVDCGTHAVRSLVFDASSGQSWLAHNEELVLDFPQPGWVEIDPDALANATIRSVRAALALAAEHRLTVIAMGLTNMRETAFTWWRASGVPASPGVMWMSLASEPIVERWKSNGNEALIRERTGLSNHSFFFGSKLAWLFDRDPALAAAAAAGELQAGTLESWLAYRLSGGTVHATDASNASRYQMLDLHEVRWSDELSAALGIPVTCLPEVRPTMSLFGMTSAEVCGAEIPITCLFADQQASLFGHGCEQEGGVKATFGTSGVVCLNTGRNVSLVDGLVTSVAWTDEAGVTQYEMEGSAFSCGYTLGWLARWLGDRIDWSAPIQPSPHPAQDRVTLLPSFTTLGAPRWPSGKGAAFLGLAMDTTAEDMVRAGVEAMAYQVYDLFAAMPATTTSTELVVDGGGAANDFLCQLMADLSGCDVTRPITQEVTSVGVAKGALRGLGREVDPYYGQDRSQVIRFHPRPDDTYARDGYAHWVDRVETVLR